MANRPICFPRNTIREGKWKLSAGKLYDLETNPAEKNDVAAQHLLGQRYAAAYLALRAQPDARGK